MPVDDIDAEFWFELAPLSAPYTPVLASTDVERAFGCHAARPLGRGAFGETWHVSGTPLVATGEAAAKVIYREGYPAARLTRETEGLQRTSSEHVVRLLTAGLVPLVGKERAVLVFEYVEGGDVAAAISAGSWPTHEQVHAFGIGVLRGLVALHETNTAHRDIKPENIALRGGDWSRPVLLDLGLSKQLDVDALTTYPQLLGTLPFMAPEQIRGEEARKAADVWALGCVLHLLLTQKHPFFGPRNERVPRTQALTIVAAGAPPLPEGVPEPLRGVATRLLSPEAHARGSAARALADLTAS